MYILEYHLRKCYTIMSNKNVKNASEIIKMKKDVVTDVTLKRILTTYLFYTKETNDNMALKSCK